MKVAVTYENGNVFQHFGHTETFKIYVVEDKNIISSEIVATGDSGHGALAGFLATHEVDVLICGGIGGGAKAALTQAGIQLLGGVRGSADDAVNAYIAGKLIFNSNITCNHHGEGHTCAIHNHGKEHSCGGGSCSIH